MPLPRIFACFIFSLAMVRKSSQRRGRRKKVFREMKKDIDELDLDLFISDTRYLKHLEEMIYEVEKLDEQMSAAIISLHGQLAETCDICFERKTEMMLKPCKHHLCFDCVYAVSKRRCPFCTNSLDGVLVYGERKLNKYTNRKFYKLLVKEK